MTSLLLGTHPIGLSVAFGTPDALRTVGGRAVALFRPERLVAYLVRYDHAQALYLLKTDASRRARTRLRNVSHPIRLFYVAKTRRTASKTLRAINLLKRRLAADSVDALPDLFWLQLADFCERRGKRVASYVTAVLDRQQLL